MIKYVYPIVTSVLHAAEDSALLRLLFSLLFPFSWAPASNVKKNIHILLVNESWSALFPSESSFQQLTYGAHTTD